MTRSMATAEMIHCWAMVDSICCSAAMMTTTWTAAMETTRSKAKPVMTPRWEAMDSTVFVEMTGPTHSMEVQMTTG